ncbi:MAG: SRPBCC domain-containing protein [Solirubrobacteraceae bacterium]|nr:SRPBCC domain-containing protein [Solirubrobacteraceae bacterium]
MTSMTEQAVVRVERIIPAPPEKVLGAWLEPELLRRWALPGRGYEVMRAEVDPRVGGRIAVWQTDDSGISIGGFDSEILELTHDRLVLGWRFVGPEREFFAEHDSLVTITVAEAPGGTLLTLVHERLDPLREGMPEVFSGVPVGWNAALDQLAEVFSRR